MLDLTAVELCGVVRDMQHGGVETFSILAWDCASSTETRIDPSGFRIVFVRRL